MIVFPFMEEGTKSFDWDWVPLGFLGYSKLCVAGRRASQAHAWVAKGRHGSWGGTVHCCLFPSYHFLTCPTSPLPRVHVSAPLGLRSCAGAQLPKPNTLKSSLLHGEPRPPQTLITQCHVYSQAPCVSLVSEPQSWISGKPEWVLAHISVLIDSFEVSKSHTPKESTRWEDNSHFFLILRKISWLFLIEFNPKRR